jgi:hypothetical protein
VSPITGADALYPSIFQVLKDSNDEIRTAACYSIYSGIDLLLDTRYVDYTYNSTNDRTNLIRCLNNLTQHAYNKGKNDNLDSKQFVFVQFNELTEVGEQFGYNSTQFWRALGRLDDRIGLLLESIRLDRTLVCTHTHTHSLSLSFFMYVCAH